MLLAVYFVCLVTISFALLIYIFIGVTIGKDVGECKWTETCFSSTAPCRLKFEPILLKFEIKFEINCSIRDSSTGHYPGYNWRFDL